MFAIERCFYVDNLLQSLPKPEEARQLVDFGNSENLVSLNYTSGPATCQVLLNTYTRRPGPTASSSGSPKTELTLPNPP